jgi:hypothetical protein
MIRRLVYIPFGFVFSLLPNACFSINTHIIFVHVGEEIPSYTYTALEQARLFNEDAHLCLIANKKALQQSPYDFTRCSIVTITCESLPQSPLHKKFNKNTTLNTRHRNGFWRKATERFFYIHEYATLHNLTNIVHLESDTMLYANVADMHNAFSLYKGIGAVFDCDTRCIPCFIYIANAQALTHLVDFIAKHALQGYNDMQILAEYHKAFFKSYIDNLPLIMPEYLREHTLINSKKQTAKFPLHYCKNSTLFNSIFDGAALGQYLGGVDPQNGPSRPGFINETSLFNPSHLTIEWHRDERNRMVPFARCKGALYRINNLHIHSKHLDNFRS